MDTIESDDDWNIIGSSVNPNSKMLDSQKDFSRTGAEDSSSSHDCGPSSLLADEECGFPIERLTQNSKSGLEVRVAYGISSPLYADCQKVRSVAGDRDLHHRFDDWSYHFVLYHLCHPVGAVTATRCADGPVDQEQFYPQELLKVHRPIAFSSCKLRINRFALQGPRTVGILTRAVWRYMADRGQRIEVMNCEVSKRGPYESVGYRCLNGYDFIHADLGTTSRVMILAADPNHPSVFRELFQSIDNTFPMSDALHSSQLTLRGPE